MSSAYFSLHIHIVFSTKNRAPLINHEWRSDLHSYIAGIIKGLGAVPECVGGVDNHVHILLSHNTNHVICDLVREIKKASSNWSSKRRDRRFAWQEGYSVFSVSYSGIGAVRRYILNQEQHHARTTFEEELKQFLSKHDQPVSKISF